MTGYSETIPGQKSAGGNLEAPLAVAADCGGITAHPDTTELWKRRRLLEELAGSTGNNWGFRRELFGISADRRYSVG